jgi:hypothetical protein
MAGEARSSTGIAHAAVTWIAFFGLYLLFAGSTQPAEFVAAAIIATAVTAFDRALGERSERPLRITFAALRPLVGATCQIPRDVARVAGAVIGSGFGPAPAGSVVAIAYPAGSVTGHRAGRAVAMAAVSLPPNAFVVGAHRAEGRLDVHRLAAEPAQHIEQPK